MMIAHFNWLLLGNIFYLFDLITSLYIQCIDKFRFFFFEQIKDKKAKNETRAAAVQVVWFFSKKPTNLDR